jgi:hypothetical protein
MFMFQLYDTEVVNFYKHSIRHLKHSSDILYTSGFNIQKFYILSKQTGCVSLCISEQTAIISLHKLKWLVSIIEIENVYC